MSTLICDSCQQHIHPGTRPHACGAPNCQCLVHSAKRCKTMSLRPQGKVSKPTASPLGDRSGTNECPDTAASAELSSTPLLWKLQTYHHLQYRPSHLQQLQHLIPSLLVWSNQSCGCHRPRKKQLDSQTLYSGSQPANRVSQSALRILQWNAGRLSYMFKCLLFV